MQLPSLLSWLRVSGVFRSGSSAAGPGRAGRRAAAFGPATVRGTCATLRWNYSLNYAPFSSFLLSPPGRGGNARRCSAVPLSVCSMPALARGRACSALGGKRRAGGGQGRAAVRGRRPQPEGCLALLRGGIQRPVLSCR